MPARRGHAGNPTCRSHVPNAAPAAKSRPQSADARDAWACCERHRDSTAKDVESLCCVIALAVTQRRDPRLPRKLTWADRAWLVVLAGLPPHGRLPGVRLIVTPGTVLRCHPTRTGRLSRYPANVRGMRCGYGDLAGSQPRDFPGAGTRVAAGSRASARRVRHSSKSAPPPPIASMSSAWRRSRDAARRVCRSWPRSVR